MVLEPASDATLQSKQRAEKDALGPSTSEKAMLNAVTPQVEPVVKRKKAPKGPNPLSVKKKVPKGTVPVTTRVEKADVRSKRKREEADDVDGASVEAQPKPKRRRRHKAASRLAERSN
jgi:U3 small nucleolar RNA-associated protein 23